MNELQLRQQCTEFFPGHRSNTPAVNFTAMAAWCEAQQISADIYGNGDYIQAFEKKIAALCGFPAAMFCITGTMAQLIALRIACQQRAIDTVGLHASSHVLLHENNNFQHLQMFKAQNIGEPFRPWLAEDVEKVPCKLAALLYELPMREIGAQLPSWEQLHAVKALAQHRDIHLHLDGARLWEAQAAYQRSLQEVCAGFDSCYVSFYKGIGAMGGAMLMGNENFIAQARIWMHRLGGNLFQRLPYVVSAAMQFDARLAAMPLYRQRAQEFAALLAEHSELTINPAQPECNLFHLYLPVSSERAITIRNQIAQEQRAWLFGNPVNTGLAQQCKTELYIGDNLLALAPSRIAELIHILLQKIHE